MKINRLDLRAFGKFNKKVLELKENINIIYGENESGKTTIHNFIDGIFYGFLRPNVRSVRYLDEHELYKPWNSNNYRGSISLTYKDIDYLIEREFTKGNENTIVYRESTGEDVSQSIEAGMRTRILQPGYHFFGFNSSVFRNTISVRQLKTKTENELSKEIKEKLINASHSLDEKISVKEAIKSLDKDLKDIGSERAPTSRYGRTKSRIEKLNNDISTINRKKDDYNSLLKEVDKLEKEYNNKSELLKDVEYLELKIIYEKGLELKNQIDELESSMEALSRYKGLNEEDFNEIKDKINEVSIIENSLKFKMDSKEKLEDKILDLSKGIESIGENEYDEITDDYLNFEIMEEERRSLLDVNRDDLRSDKLKGYYKKGKRYIISMIGVFLLTIAFIFIPPLLIAGSIILLVLGFLTYKNSSNIKKEKDSIEYEHITKKFEDIDREKKRILDKHKVDYLAQLKDLYEEIKYKKFKRDEVEEDIRLSEMEVNALRDDISNLEEKKKLNLERIDKLLKNNKMLLVEDFEKGLSFKRDYEKKVSQIEDKKLLYKRVMDKHSLANLKEKLREYNPISEVDILDKERLMAEISELRLEIARNDTNINHLEKELERGVLLEEELKEKETLISNMDKEIAAIELAKSTIEQLSKNIHEDSAPDINNRVSNIINKITMGKYSNIRVDDKLGLKIINPESNEFLMVDSLSGGTIDQLYFSLRFGIISSISHENLPLILDDCFIQYDDNRLKNVLELLTEISKERQIILFTCHNREKEFLDELEADYNLIELR